MMKRTINARNILIAPLVLLAPGMSFAQVDTSDWTCESCPFDQGYRAEVAAGATSVSDDAARFGNYTGYDEKGVYANVDGQGRYNRNGYRPVSYTHLTLPTIVRECSSRWSPDH